jgi:hypothetical protein
LLTERWRAMLDHPILRLELQRIRRKRWWPGRRFFLFYPALLGAALGYGVMLALANSLGVQVVALVTGLPLACLVGVITWLLSLALPWIAPALTATTIARERELGTFDLLRTTLLTERSIVLGKLGGCLAWLWPGILTLVLLSPFQIVQVSASSSWGGLLGPLHLPALMTDPAYGVERWWVWLLLSGMAGWLRIWGDLALHAAVGLFVSVLVRSSGAAIAISYGAILAARAVLWLMNSFLVPVLVVLLAGSLASSRDLAMASLEPMGFMLFAPGLMGLVMTCVEIAAAGLLVWAAVWWLKRA